MKKGELYNTLSRMDNPFKIVEFITNWESETGNEAPGGMACAIVANAALLTGESKSFFDRWYVGALSSNGCDDETIGGLRIDHLIYEIIDQVKAVCDVNKLEEDFRLLPALPFNKYNRVSKWIAEIIVDAEIKGNLELKLLAYKAMELLEEGQGNPIITGAWRDRRNAKGTPSIETLTQ